MKIADFFIQITAKGDLKELKMIADAQKTMKERAKIAVAAAKLRIQELKKETAEINAQSKLQKQQAKEEAKKPKGIKEYLITNGKLFDQQRKQVSLLAKGVLQTVLMKNYVAALSVGFVASFIALDKVVTKLVQANQLYANFQRQTGLPLRGALGVSGAMANLDVTMTPQDIMQNMQNLQNSLIGVQFGMGNIAPYQMAGINPFGLNPENMLDVIRRQMKGFAPAYRTFLLQQMGLDPRLGALIDLSDTEYLKYKQEALELYLSPQDRKTIQELAPEWNKVNLKFSKAWDKTVLLLMQDFQGLATEIGHVIDVIYRLIEITNTVLKPILDILNMVLKPLYYLLDDIVVWLLGGKSIIGDMFHGIFPTKKEWIKLLREAFGMPAITLGEDVNKWFGDKNFLTAPYRLGKWIGGGLADLLLPKNLTGTTNNYGKNVSMQNNFDIKVGSVADGYAMTDAINSYFTYNGIISQISRY